MSKNSGISDGLCMNELLDDCDSWTFSTFLLILASELETGRKDEAAEFLSGSFDTIDSDSHSDIVRPLDKRVLLGGLESIFSWCTARTAYELSFDHSREPDNIL